MKCLIPAAIAKVKRSGGAVINDAVESLAFQTLQRVVLRRWGMQRQALGAS